MNDIFDEDQEFWADYYSSKKNEDEDFYYDNEFDEQFDEGSDK